METTFAKLNALVAEQNRKIITEAIITLLVGIATCVIVYGMAFWIVWLAIIFFGGSYRQHAILIAAIIVVVFVIFSIWYASRGFDPIRDVDIDLSVKRHHGADLIVGLALGIPILRRESLAGFASLLIGGPANLLDAWSLWQGRLHADANTISQAQEVFASARQGIAVEQISNPYNIVLLHRLGLVKAISHGNGRIELQTTAKGTDLLMNASPSTSLK